MASLKNDTSRLAREIEHHRQIADQAEMIWTWDSPAGRRRADRRANLFIEHGQLKRGVRALELGCGTGVFLGRVAGSGAQLHGIDLSTHLLAKAQVRLVAHLNVALSCGNAEQMPFPDAVYDVVYGSSVLHHLDLEASLQEVSRVLRPGGRIVFAEPNILNPQVFLMFHLGLTKKYFGVSPDEMAFSRFRARAVLTRLGYEDVSVRPLDFLHPSVPAAGVEVVSRVGERLEKVPLLREVTGSLLILARKA